MTPIDFSSIPLFTGVPEDVLVPLLLAAGAYRCKYKKGNFISFESDRIENIGIVLSGHIHMIKEDIWGERTLLVRIGRNELFWEIFACADQKVSNVTFQATEDTEVLLLPYRGLLKLQPDANVLKILENLISLLATKGQRFTKKIEVISRKTLEEKISTFLSLEAQKHGSKDFTIALSRTELAEYLCANRSAIARELKSMEERGLIKVEGRRFRLLK